MNLIDKIIQSVIDVGIGFGVYFTLSAFFPEVNSNGIVVIALVVTSIFAETVEVRFKK